MLRWAVATKQGRKPRALSARTPGAYIRDMFFDVSAAAYARFMGRFSEPLAVEFVDFADPQPGQRALDVGCGPGALTAQLVSRLGTQAVSAIDPSASFVEAIRERCPGIDVRAGVAEHLPYADHSFDLALAQLVVHFMSDPVAGLAQMKRVTRIGGVVAACVWDHGGPGGPLSTFWQAVHDVDPNARDESGLAGSREGHLAELARSAGLKDIEPTRLVVSVPFRGFEEWWKPFTLGVGPAGAYVAGLEPPVRQLLKERCARRMPTGPFEVTATAWGVRARA